MTNAPINKVRLALSADFDNVVRCLLPMAYADQMPWATEEDLLNNFAAAAKASETAAKGLVFSTTRSKYCLRILSEKMHKRIWVEFPLRHRLRTCEIGDILMVSKYIEPQGIVSRSVCFLQVKASDKKKSYNAWKIDKNQLNLYARWPPIQTCYVGSGLTKTVLSRNLRITHKNRLFSPYLLAGRNCQPSLHCGPISWITGADLIAAASQASGTMHGPLELPLLFHLIQMLFQTTGEQDVYRNRTRNTNLRSLVDSILGYVKLNDPPEGEGRPFVALTLIVKKMTEQ